MGGGGGGQRMGWSGKDEEKERRANKEGQTKMGEWGRGRWGVEKEWAGERDRWGRKREMGEKEREVEERKIIFIPV